MDIEGGGEGMLGLVSEVKDDNNVVEGKKIRMIKNDEERVVKGFEGKEKISNMEGSKLNGRRNKKEIGKGRLLEEKGKLID